jgi:hypothetical protein
MAEIKLWKWLYYWKQSMDSMQYPPNSNAIQTEIEKSILKFISNSKRPWLDKAILNKKSNAIDINTWFQIIHYHSNKHHVPGTKKPRYVHQWNRSFREKPPNLNLPGF